MPSANSSAYITRPGMFSTHRGRRVLVWMIVAVILMFLLALISGALRDDETSAAEGAGEDEEVTQAQMLAEQASVPDTEAAPANPFTREQTAQLPAEFTASADYESMVRTAEDAALGLGGYSSQLEPEDYIEQVPRLDENAQEELLKQAKESWPAVEDAGVTVTASASGMEPNVRSYSADTNLASLEVVVNQRATKEGVEQDQQAVGYVIHLRGAPGGDAQSSAPAGAQGADGMQWTVMGASAM